MGFRDVPGVLVGFRGVPGDSGGGVPMVFRGVPGGFRFYRHTM